jgi:hypothetical protein
MFWDRFEVEWSPGSGNKKVFRLLGRVGERAPKLEVCDFRQQRGIYVLYDDFGPYYVGLTNGSGLGQRLKDHTLDDHRDQWDRFSWFGFRRVSTKSGPDGVKQLEELGQHVRSGSRAAIGEIEALLIQSLGTYRTGNRQQMRFPAALRWEQVRWDQWDTYLLRVSK